MAPLTSAVIRYSKATAFISGWFILLFNIIVANRSILNPSLYLDSPQSVKKQRFSVSSVPGSLAELKEEVPTGLDQIYKMLKQISREQILLRKISEDLSFVIKATTSAHQDSLQGQSSRTEEAETRSSTLEDNMGSIRITPD